jgi:two-component system response regulator AtoC
MKKETIKIVIVEDNPFFNKILQKYVQNLCNSQFYQQYQFEVTTYLYAEDCIENLDNDTDIMLLDYLFVNIESDEHLTGIDVLKEVQKNCTDCKVIMISEQQNMVVTMELLKKGVYEYIDKNLNNHNRIGAVVQKILQERSKLAS